MNCNRMQDEELTGQKMELLYGEADAETRARVDAHLGECEACRDELRALGRLRQSLRAWTIESGSRPLRMVPPRRLPPWLAAAAALVAGIGIGIGVGSAIAARGDASLRRELVAQEARTLEREERQGEEVARLRAALDRRPPELTADALLERVDARLAQTVRRSERDQDARLEAAIEGWEARMEAQRRVDLARVAAGLSYLDGQNGRQLARTNELMGYVLDAASPEEGP